MERYLLLRDSPLARYPYEAVEESTMTFIDDIAMSRGQGTKEDAQVLEGCECQEVFRSLANGSLRFGKHVPPFSCARRKGFSARPVDLSRPATRKAF